jgi:hypothetical protein
LKIMWHLGAVVVAVFVVLIAIFELRVSKAWNHTWNDARAVQLGQVWRFLPLFPHATFQSGGVDLPFNLAGVHRATAVELPARRVSREIRNFSDVCYLYVREWSLVLFIASTNEHLHPQLTLRPKTRLHLKRQKDDRSFDAMD